MKKFNFDITWNEDLKLWRMEFAETPIEIANLWRLEMAINLEYLSMDLGLIGLDLKGGGK